MPLPTLDLVIRGTIVVTAERRDVADIGIARGQIAQIGGSMRGRKEIRATGLFSLPGGVDPHVHLTNELPTSQVAGPQWVDDFASGSSAALAGGITSLGNMTFCATGATMIEAVSAATELVKQQSLADVFLHPVLAPCYPAALDDLSRLHAGGHRSLKVFMSTPEFDHNFEQYVAAFRAAAQLGMIVLIHCEDAGVIHDCTADLLARGCGLRHFAESRPPLAEVQAVHRAIALCEQTGARIYVVHLSCAEALAACEEARDRGLPVHVETRPLYLHFTAERYGGADGPLFVGQPPLRQQADVEALWAAMRRGSIDTLGSDHAPWTVAQKMDPQHTLQQLRPGVADLETMLPVLLSETAQRRELSLERIVALTAANPARLFGLYPRKGTIAVGADADLVLWDLSLPRTIEGSKLHSRAGYTPYEGMTVSAWPRITIRRGEVVFEDGEILAVPGSGQILARGTTTVPRA